MKRRTSILISATMLLALTSCDKTIPLEPEQNSKSISFNASWEGVAGTTILKTRATEISNVNIADFGVYAYYEADKFNQSTSTALLMNNQKVVKISGEWRYNPILYWPPHGTISFFGYAPFAANESLTVSTTGIPIFDYTNPSLVAEQHDLLLSYPQIDKSVANVDANKKIPLKFKHSLSNVIFKAKILSSVTDVVKIESVTISSLKNRATATFSENNLVESGWNLNWELNPAATDDNYTLSITNDAFSDLDIKNNTEPVVITSTNGHLMVIPQDVDPTDQITIVLTFGGDVRTTSVALNTLIPKFEPTKRYSILITVISKVDITITSTVKNWTEEVIDVPEFN